MKAGADSRDNLYYSLFQSNKLSSEWPQATVQLLFLLVGWTNLARMKKLYKTKGECFVSIRRVHPTEIDGTKEGETAGEGPRA